MDWIVFLNQLSNINSTQEENKDNFILCLKNSIPLELYHYIVDEEVKNENNQINILPCDFSCFNDSFIFKINNDNSIEENLKYLNDKYSKIENHFGVFELNFNCDDNDDIIMKIISSKINEFKYTFIKFSNEYDYKF